MPVILLRNASHLRPTDMRALYLLNCIIMLYNYMENKSTKQIYISSLKKFSGCVMSLRFGIKHVE